MRVGFGYDSHRLVEGRKLILGGVEVSFEKGSLVTPTPTHCFMQWEMPSSVPPESVT